MAYKNWKKNYHARRISRRWWTEKNFCWWHYTYTIKDWKTTVNEGEYRYFYVTRAGSKYRIYEGGHKFKGELYSAEHFTLEEVSKIAKNEAYIESKKLVSSGGYRNGRKTYGKKMFESRQRMEKKKIERHYMEGYGDDDFHHSTIVGKDRKFGWIID